MLTGVAHGHRLGRRAADGAQPAGPGPRASPFLTQANFLGSRNLRELSVYTTGATTTLAGSGPGGYDGNGFHDGDNGANAQFGEPTGVAIDPDGTFALVAVRAWPPAPHASWPSPAAAHPPRTHAPQARSAALQVVPAATHPASGSAPRLACARARCIAGQ